MIYAIDNTYLESKKIADDAFDLGKYVTELKSSHKHTVIVFGFCGKRYCYLDVPYSEALSRVQSDSDLGDFIFEKESYWSVSILGFDDHFEA